MTNEEKKEISGFLFGLYGTLNAVGNRSNNDEYRESFYALANKAWKYGQKLRDERE